MKDKIRKYMVIIRSTVENGLEKARSIGLGKKLLVLIAGIIVVATVLGILIRVLSILFDTITVFVNEHFLVWLPWRLRAAGLLFDTTRRRERQRNLLRRKGQD